MSEDRVASVSWRSFAVPLRSEFAASWGGISVRSGIAVWLETVGGIRGEGEASPLSGFSGGSLEETASALGTLARWAIGHPLEDLWACEPPLAGLSPGAAAAARCGFETAAAGAIASVQGLPLFSFLAVSNGKPDVSGPFSIPVNATLDDREPGAVAGAAARAVSEGFRALKLKVGGDVALDADRVAAAREAAPALELRVDANRAWSAAQASRFFELVAPCRLALCEEPVAPGPAQFAELARLRSHFGIRLGIDESCTGEDALRAASAAEAADVAVIKPMLHGMRNAAAMISTAAELGLTPIVTTTFDAGLGTMAAAHLAALLPEPVSACGLATLDRLADGLVDCPPAVRNGRLEIPAALGLGAKLRSDALSKFGTQLQGRVE